jgi:hypothetical protein
MYKCVVDELISDRWWHTQADSPLVLVFVFSGSAAQRGLWPPAAQRGLWPPRPRGFLITHTDTPQLLGLLWTSDQSVAETSAWQHTTHTTNIHAPGWIRTHNCNRRGAVDLCLRPRGNCDRLFSSVGLYYVCLLSSKILSQNIFRQMWAWLTVYSVIVFVMSENVLGK